MLEEVQKISRTWSARLKLGMRREDATRFGLRVLTTLVPRSE